MSFSAVRKAFPLQSIPIRTCIRLFHQSPAVSGNNNTPSSTTPLKRFFVYAPDKKDEGTLAMRYKVRPLHLEGIAPLIAGGVVQVGGMTVTPDSADLEGTDRKAVASMLIIKAKSLEDVKAMIESDIYYTSGVWDDKNITILPFFSATPFPP